MQKLRSFLSSMLRYPKRFFRWFRRTRLRNKIIVTILLIIVGIAFAGIFGGEDGGGYVTEPARRGDIVQVVTETGEVSTGGTTSIYSPTNGVVEEVYVANGEVVARDQELFTVISTATEQEEASAYANYLQAKTVLDSANAAMYTLQSQMFSAWDTYKEYAEDHESDDDRAQAEFHVKEKDWLAAEAKYKDQKAVVSQAQAGMSAAWLAYQATQNATVKATADGTVANLSVAPGGAVRAFSPTTPVSPALSIANFAITEVAVQLGESDIAKIQEGQDAVIDVKAVDSHEYKGVVERIDTIGTDVQGITKYNVYIGLQGSDELLRSGMSADVDITTDRLEDVLLVPNSAVKPYQGGRAVRITREDGEIEYIPVRVGVRGVSETEILSGIEEGQEVVISLPNDGGRSSLF